MTSLSIWHYPTFTQLFWPRLVPNVNFLPVIWNFHRQVALLFRQSITFQSSLLLKRERHLLFHNYWKVDDIPLKSCNYRGYALQILSLIFIVFFTGFTSSQIRQTEFFSPFPTFRKVIERTHSKDSRLSWLGNWKRRDKSRRQKSRP